VVDNITYGERLAQIDFLSEFGCCIHDDRRVHFLDPFELRFWIPDTHSLSLAPAALDSFFLSFSLSFPFLLRNIPRTESFFSGSRKKARFEDSRKGCEIFLEISTIPPRVFSLSLSLSLSLTLTRS